MSEKCDRCGIGEMKNAPVKNYKYRTNLGTIVIEGTTVFKKCQKCGHMPLTGELIDRWNRNILKALLKVRHAFTSKELMFIFSVLPFTQKEIADAVGKDKGTITNHKTGKCKIDKSVNHLLREIIDDYVNDKKDTLEELEAISSSDDEPTAITKIAACPSPRD